MDHRASPPTVAAVVAAHDEEARLADVLETLVTYPGFDEVVVVDDGSTDSTAEVARAAGATCLQLPSNRGKGAALQAGVMHVGTDVLFFADADIRDLDHATITVLLDPVRRGETDMFVAMRHRSIYHVRSVLRFLPLLGGERAVSAKLWHSVPDRYKHRFRIEAALNFYAVHHGRGLRYRVFPITQTRKEVKYGLLRGFARRVRMAANVGAAIVDVQLTEAPPDAQSRRRAVLVAVTGTAALIASLNHRPGGRAVVGSRSSASSVVGTGVVAWQTARRGGSMGTALVSGAVVLAQLVRLAQSQARADG